MNGSFGLPIPVLLLCAGLSACTAATSRPTAVHDVTAGGHERPERRTLNVGDVALEVSPVASVEERRHAGLFMQQHDFSCGAASLATLLHFHFGEGLDEAGVMTHVRLLFDAEARAHIERDGLSFTELEVVARALGYRAAGVRLTKETLRALSVPVIAYLERGDYRHFVVLKGVHGERVLLADPSRGNVTMPWNAFARQWDGRTFVVGQEGFVAPASDRLLVDRTSPADGARSSVDRLSRSTRDAVHEPLARSPRHPRPPLPR